MKKLLFIALTITVLFTSCKKDEEQTDSRAQFVGSYNSTLTIKVPALLWDQSYPHTYTFEKSADDGKLIVTDDAGGIMTANVSGNTYTYDNKTIIGNEGGVAISVEITGSGSISGNKITELGSYNITSGGVTYPGTWSCSHTRK
jgi:hypothetical protein